jgi:hypothetical protein
MTAELDTKTMSPLWVRLSGAGCALLLTWSSALACLAQELRLDVRHALRASEAARVLPGAPRVREQRQPLFWAAAGTSAAMAAGFAFSEGFSYRANSERINALAKSRDPSLDMQIRLRASERADTMKFRSELLERVSSVCLAGSIAATGTMLLVWLTAKEQRKKPGENKYLLGPMVLREFAGAGLVLREKF